jgi:hypothetical protein
MTAANHVTTGALLAAVLPLPAAVMLAVAFLAHFALDSLPHYGEDELPKNSKKYTRILLIDCTLVLVVLATIIAVQPPNAWLLVLSGLACASPDFMWLPNYIREHRGKPAKEHKHVVRLHKWVQWAERPYGYYYEIFWFVTVGSLLLYAMLIQI